MPVELATACEVKRVHVARPRIATWLVILLAGLIPLIGRAVLIPVLGIPKPAIQDEFSYLLAADTFAHGRLANPTPHHPEHFETLQELVRPAYASKYPPLSSIAMAFGQKLFGEPWIGVWLGMGVLCATICWALLGWMPRTWAIAGTLIAIVRIGIVSYWTETYWGGSWAAIGGALLIGAVPRLVRGPRAKDALVFAAGLGMLANTRPYEGLLLAVVCGGYFVFTFVRRRTPLRILIQRLILPAAVLLLPVFAWMGYYNFRVTGHVLEMPYSAYDKQYTIWSPWMWQSTPRPAPAYDNPVVRDFWVVAFEKEYQFARQHFLKTRVSDLLAMARFFLGWPVILCILAAAIPLGRDPRARLALLLGAVFYAGCAMDARLFPHYVAPGTALVYVMAGLALRTMWRRAPGSLSERRLLAVGLAALILVTTAAGLFTPKNRYYFSATDYHVKAKHARIEDQLRHEPGDHLVLVRYHTGHDAWEELVYNAAEIDSSRIVWAHSLGFDKDRDLIRFYGKRQVWLLEEDGEAKLKRYPASTESTTPTHLE
ncbi:MAG TPA: hypothetical protein VKT81_25775 [Bryobacteraceae bacterium]|nr:hypothetical protein [Bryobacteraceae bacterium]